MKILLIALAFVGANAMACPDATKDASAPGTDTPRVAATVKAKPAATPRAGTKTTSTTQVAVEPSTDGRKATTL